VNNDREALQLQGELVSRKNLEALNPQQFSSILLLADSTAASGITDADSRNLATLLLLRDIQAQALKGAAASETPTPPSPTPHPAPPNPTPRGYHMLVEFWNISTLPLLGGIPLKEA